MKTALIGTLVATGLALSACATTETATRNAGFPQSSVGNADVPAPLAALDVSVKAVRVAVPETLVVSEENRYYPSGDIVWREDPIGDRYAQVKAIFEEGLGRGAKTLSGSRAVYVDVRVERFHALTEKARYTIGGVHSIQFAMIVRDAQTGEIIRGPRLVEADLKAYGGDEAIAAEAQGITQKVRITEHLANVLAQELTLQEGHKNARLGVIQAINKF